MWARSATIILFFIVFLICMANCNRMLNNGGEPLPPSTWISEGAVLKECFKENNIECCLYVGEKLTYKKCRRCSAPNCFFDMISWEVNSRENNKLWQETAKPWLNYSNIRRQEEDDNRGEVEEFLGTPGLGF